MSASGKHYHHGRTPAAWTGSIIAAVGFLGATIGFVANLNWVLIWASVAVILIGAAVGGVMSKMGLGQA